MTAPSRRRRISTRTFTRRAAAVGRRVSSPARALPDFLVIGAQRGGTSALYSSLGAHPGVAPAAHKELHFFDLHHHRGVRWYRAQFPLRSTLRRMSRQGPGPGVTGEASPYYLAHPLAPVRAHELVPNARLVALLRNPTDRAYSHWRYRVGRGGEHLSFLDAVRAEPDRIRGEEERILAGRDRPGAPHQTRSYLGRGRYAEQLERWFRHYPRHRVLLLRSEELFAEPARAWDRLTSFLGLGSAPPPPFVAQNASTGAELDGGARRLVDDLLAADNQRLLELTGIDVTAPVTTAGRAARG